MFKRPLKVLFLCTGNSSRSQIAEGWANHLFSHRVKAYSAGTGPAQVHPLAVKVMKEARVEGTEEKKLKAFREVRDAIKRSIQELLTVEIDGLY